MSKISLKTVMANALWKKHVETGINYVSLYELEIYKDNVINKIMEKQKEIKNNTRYSVQFSPISIKNTIASCDCFYLGNDRIYIDKSQKNWESYLI